MNIVYVTDYYVHPLMGGGGIARTTRIMAKALRDMYGYKCYSVYVHPIDEKPTDSFIFEEELQWQNQPTFCEYVRHLGRCVIIVQIPCAINQEIYNCACSLPEAKIITVYHGAPSFELEAINKEVAWYHLKNRIETKWTLKQLFLSVLQSVLPYKFLARLLYKKYSLPCKESDKMVVLAPSVIEQYNAIALQKREKYVAIPNARSFDKVTIPNGKYDNKEVLVVARIEDWQKRILDILKIWSEVQQNSQYADWHLRIVGEGIDLPFYKRYINRNRIANVYFEGLQNPLPYYLNASIFLMTSAFEGLPMTILEAQQCGCIPILYDSFASAKDIVSNGVNGILVTNKDRNEYVQKLKELMSNADLRKKMSASCIRSSENYSVEKVASQWNKLFESLC